MGVPTCGYTHRYMVLINVGRYNRNRGRPNLLIHVLLFTYGVVSLLARQHCWSTLLVEEGVGVVMLVVDDGGGGVPCCQLCHWGRRRHRWRLWRLVSSLMTIVVKEQS